jgi:AraC-like DNA-binding protein
MALDLLARHPAIATTDLDRAREEVAARFCPHRLALEHPDGRLDLVHNAASIGTDVALHYMRYGDAVHISPGRFGRFFLVQIPLRGSAVVRVGDRVVASDRHRASVGSPTEAVDMRWAAGCEKLVVYLRREAVEEAVRERVDDTRPVVFDPALELSSRPGQAWLRLVRVALDALEADDQLLTTPMVASHFEQTLISGLLSIQASSVEPGPSPAVSASRAVRTVLSLIEDDPARPWRVAELAGAVGVSTRRLQELFASELGTSPLDQLRRVRLEHAHHDLVSGDPHTTTVAEVAAAWGFFHLGRFARDYRATYAELPSETLAR